MAEITKAEIIDKLEWLLLIVGGYLISVPLTKLINLKPVNSIIVGVVIVFLVLFFFETSK